MIERVRKMISREICKLVEFGVLSLILTWVAVVQLRRTSREKNASTKLDIRHHNSHAFTIICYAFFIKPGECNDASWHGTSITKNITGDVSISVILFRIATKIFANNATLSFTMRALAKKNCSFSIYGDHLQISSLLAC